MSRLSLDDSALCDLANRHMEHHRVSFVDALRTVVQELNSVGGAASFAEHPAGVDAASSDHALDAAARRHAALHGVSYAEALRSFGNETVSFREATGQSSAVASLEGAPIEIFEAGNRIDDNGRHHHFSVAMLKAIAAAYAPQVREAPMTVGHPATDRPAYGWVRRLEATESGKLMMWARQVDPAFAEMVRAGRFKKRSAAFYPPGHPSSPTPDFWYLRHVGWLGAMQPAVAGLKDHEFVDDLGAVVFSSF